MKKVHLTENKFTLLVENSIDRKVNKSIAYYAKVSDFNEIRKIRATILNHIPNGRVRGGKWLPTIVSWFLLGTMPQSEYKRLNKFLGWLRDNKYPNSDINDTDWHNLPFSYIKEAYDDLLDNGQEQPSDVAKINKKVQKINGYTIRRIDSQEEGNYVGHVYGYAWCILDNFYDEVVDDCTVYIISNDKTLNTAKPIPTRVIKDKLNKMGYSEIADELYTAGEGKIGTDEVLVGYKEDTAEIERLKAVYKPYYKSHCDIKTGPYEGIEDLILKLRENNIATAVVSNKPDEAVQALCKRYFKGLFDFALGQRDEIRRKPERDMVDITLKKLGITKDEAIYVGDSDVDLYTAKNSGLDCISVDWGFRTKEYLLNSGADNVVSSCDEIFNIVVR